MYCSYRLVGKSNPTETKTTKDKQRKGKLAKRVSWRKEDRKSKVREATKAECRDISWAEMQFSDWHLCSILKGFSSPKVSGYFFQKKKSNNYKSNECITFVTMSETWIQLVFAGHKLIFFPLQKMP